MDVPVLERVLAELAKLRRELQGEPELEALCDWRRGLDAESRQRVLEILEATENQLADEGRGQQGLDGSEPGASAQVRGSAKIAKDMSAHVA
jgi:hypothetical protein